jgi:hypothetical protein
MMVEVEDGDSTPLEGIISSRRSFCLFLFVGRSYRTELFYLGFFEVGQMLKYFENRDTGGMYPC